MATGELTREFRLDEFEVRPSLRQMVGPEGSVTVEARSMDVLVLLAERVGEVVSRTTLLNAVWGEQFVSEEVLTHAIWDLRRALGDDPKRSRFIQTVPKRGYRLVAEVSWPGPADRRQPSRLRWLWGGAALLAMAVGIAGWHIRSSSPPASPPLRAVPLTGSSGMEVWPALSPSGDRVAFVWNGGNDGRFHLYVKYVKPGEVGDAVQLTDQPADDYSPAWSPDGREIAFQRTVRAGAGRPGESVVVIVPALGGSERKLATIATSERPAAAWLPGLDWSPDGRHLAVVDGAPEEPSAIFLLSVETGEKRRLTAPPPESGDDTQPAFSPDGRTLAFIRGNKIYLQSLAGGEPELLLEMRRYMLDVNWVPDGSAIVFASGSEAESSTDLRRIPVGGGTPVRFPFGGVMTDTFSIARQGARLVYEQRSYFNRDLWRLDGPGAKQRGEPARLTAASRADWNPEFSPDGTRIAFASERSGANNIWLCASDGKECTQVTQMSRAAGFSWSPDGTRIVFEAIQKGRGLYVVDLESRLTRRLIPEGRFDYISPGSWSQDGRWIYISGWNRGEPRQVWKVPAAGGQPIQITREGGRGPRESADGQSLYYQVSDGGRGCTIRRIPVAGGEELPFEPKIDCDAWSSWSLWEESLVYLAWDGERSHLEHLDLETRQVARLFSFDRSVGRVGGGLTVSPDGRWVVVVLRPPEESDLMLVEGFR